MPYDVSIGESKEFIAGQPSSAFRARAQEIAEQQKTSHYASQMEIFYGGEIPELGELFAQKAAEIEADGWKEHAIIEEQRQDFINEHGISPEDVKNVSKFQDAHPGISLTAPEVKEFLEKNLDLNPQAINIPEALSVSGYIKSRAHELVELKEKIWAEKKFTAPDREIEFAEFDDLYMPDISETEMFKTSILIQDEDNPNVAAFISGGEVYVYDTRTFSVGTNVTSHITKKLGKTPQEDQVLMLKFQGGNMKETDSDQDYDAIEDTLAISEAKSAAAYEFAGKKLGLHLGAVALKANSPFREHIFGAKNAEIFMPSKSNVRDDFEFHTFVHVQNIVPGVQLNKLDLQQLTPAQKIEIAQKTIQAVQDFHKSNYFHRDIRPSNLLVDIDESGAIKVACIDTGAAVEKPKSYSRTPLTTFVNSGKTLTSKDLSSITDESSNSEQKVQSILELIRSGTLVSYTHPEVVIESIMLNEDSFLAGSPMAPNLEFTEAHETYSVRKTLQDLGLDIAVSVDQEDSLETLSKEVESIGAKLNTRISYDSQDIKTSTKAKDFPMLDKWRQIEQAAQLAKKDREAQEARLQIKRPKGLNPTDDKRKPHRS